MTGITSITRDWGPAPSIVRIVTTDPLATVSAANYILNQAANIQAANEGNFTWASTDFVLVAASDGWNFFSISNNFLSLIPYTFSGAPLVASDSTSSATPGTIRALVGKMTGTAVTMTSGNLVGTRGEVDAVGASGGFWYGTQGKIIPTGTLSGSLWAACVFGQFDVSAATINGAQCAALWGDWGATGATATDLSGCSGIKFTNTTSNKLNEQINTYGDATFYLNIRGNPGPLSYYLAAGTSGGSAGDAAHCAAQQVLKVVIQGATCYIPVFTQNS